MISNVELTRRSVVTRGALLGATACFETLHDVIGPHQSNAPLEILKALGIDRINLEPDSIVERFANARLGILTSYYQLFWPLHHFAGIDALDRAAAQFLEQNPTFKRKHRLYTLRVIARLHAIADASPEKQSQYVNDIIGWSRLWSDPRSGGLDFRRRDALGTIWEAATAALTRDFENWASFRADKLADEAILFCEKFSDQDFPELLHAAVCAFQFALTYERSMAYRGETAAYLGLRAKIERFVDRSGGRSSWFGQLHSLYESARTFAEMPAQANELLIGNQSHKSSLVDFFILARVQSSFQTRHAAASSPFIVPSDGAGWDTWQIFQNYEISDRRIRRLLDNAETRSDPRIGLTDSAKKEFPTAVQKRDAQPATDYQRDERASAPLIRSLVPFRSHAPLLRVRESGSSEVQYFGANAFAVAFPKNRFERGRIRDIAVSIGRDWFKAVVGQVAPKRDLDSNNIESKLNKALDCAEAENFVSRFQRWFETQERDARRDSPWEVAVLSRSRTGETAMENHREPSEAQSAAMDHEFEAFVRSLGLSVRQLADEDEGQGLPSPESIDEFLASIKGREEEIVKAEIDYVRAKWSDHPLGKLVDLSGAKLEDQ